MSTFNGLYTIRDYKDSDKNFILSTFLKGLYYGDSWFSLIPKQIFMDYYKNIAVALLTHPNVVIKVACLSDDPDIILGYSILSKDLSTIHWVFSKSAWRNKGIGASLVPTAPTTVTHLSALGKTLIKRFPNIIFNPFQLG